jgi:hypothetical protein
VYLTCDISWFSKTDFRMQLVFTAHFTSLSHILHLFVYSYRYTEGGTSRPFGAQVLDAKLHEVGLCRLNQVDT